MKLEFCAVSFIELAPFGGEKIKDIHTEADRVARELRCDVAYEVSGTKYRIPNHESF